MPLRTSTERRTAGHACAAQPTRHPEQVALQERGSRSEAQKEVGDLAQKLPAHKWLAALPQLTSRICHPHQGVRALTQDILRSVAVAYPQQARPGRMTGHTC